MGSGGLQTPPGSAGLGVGGTPPGKPHVRHNPTNSAPCRLLSLEDLVARRFLLPFGRIAAAALLVAPELALAAWPMAASAVAPELGADAASPVPGANGCLQDGNSEAG